MKKHTVIGILAHVDAGKTTLAEAMLFQSGVLRKPGRVDHGDTAMDTHELERKRGITIFASQAVFPLDNCEVTLLDTPGHVDFSASTPLCATNATPPLRFMSFIRASCAGLKRPPTGRLHSIATKRPLLS